MFISKSVEIQKRMEYKKKNVRGSRTEDRGVKSRFYGEGLIALNCFTTVLYMILLLVSALRLANKSQIEIPCLRQGIS